MVARTYFRLALIITFFVFGHSLTYSMNNNIDIALSESLTKYNDKSLLIIDVRTENEWKVTGVIPHSKLISMHDNNYQERLSFLEELKQELNEYKSKDIALICASGARSEIVVNHLLAEGYNNIYHIPEGITGKNKNGWLYMGYPMVKYKQEEEAN